MVTFGDLIGAVDTAWEIGGENPACIDHQGFLHFLQESFEANVQKREQPVGYAATLGWGITIGVLAERVRRMREDG